MSNDWILGIYSSGGSAHERAMDELSKEILNIYKVNVLSSNCTYLPFIGKFCAWAWNQSQKNGNVSLQILLGKLLHVAEKLFALPTYITIYQLLLRKEKKLPKKIVATAPIFLAAICRAVLNANAHSKNDKIESIDLHMIEPPTDDALYYFETIKNLAKKEKSLIQVFAEHPLQEDIEKAGSEENYWREKTGLEFQQIVFDPPVKKVFKEDVLPVPGENVSLFLEGYKESFEVAAQDRVGLIMLGGIPTSDAILKYVQTAIKLAKEHPTQKDLSRRFLFVACGKKEFRLYDQVVELMTNQDIPSYLKIIPFLNQPVEKIFGRADFSITRTGGMTSLEILKLKRRKQDNKLVLLHAQLNNPNHFEFSKTKDSQEFLIKKGIPLWEGGNARYLCKIIPDVYVVTPEKSSLYMAKKFYS